MFSKECEDLTILPGQLPFKRGKLTVLSIIAFYTRDHPGTFDSLMSGSRSCIALRVRI